MRQIKAKPAIFKGTAYRSKLEIYWAAFFENMGIDFEYEPKYYSLPSGNYLPDFYLKNVTAVGGKWLGSHPRKGVWLEVKNPEKCLKADGELDTLSKPVKLLDELASITDTPATIVWVRPVNLPYIETMVYRSPWCEDWCSPQFWKCPECNNITMSGPAEHYGMIHEPECSLAGVALENNVFFDDFWYDMFIPSGTPDVIFYGSKTEELTAI